MKPKSKPKSKRVVRTITKLKAARKRNARVAVKPQPQAVPAKSALAPYPPPPPLARITDTVSIDHIVEKCGRNLIISGLSLSQNPRIQRFIELWRLTPDKSMDELCVEADIPGDVLIGTATQLLVRVHANVTKVIAATGHPEAMKTTVKQAAKPANFDERMAFHTMMGWQTQPNTRAPLINQNFTLPNQGVPTLSQCPDPINVHPVEDYYDAEPTEEDETVAATLAPARLEAGTGRST